MSEENNIDKSELKFKKKAEIEKIPVDRLRGRVVIINPEESEFAKNLKFHKKGDYFKKK